MKSFIALTDQAKIKEQVAAVLATMNTAEDRLSWRELTHRLSAVLEVYLTERLEVIPGFDKVGVVTLGSWARSELCPRSDIDVLLLGSDENVLAYVNLAAEQKLHLQYRSPKNPDLWGEGVEVFDRLALLFGRSLKESDENSLVKQQGILFEKIESVRRNVAEHMRQEQQKRNSRYDSLANYLEPNLKYGPGGGRDAYQALTLARLYRDLFSQNQPELQWLEEKKSFLLVVRYVLHLQGAGDILQASLVPSVAKELGFDDPRDFNREVQNALSEISFYSRWVFEKIKLSRETPRVGGNQPPSTLSGALEYLSKNTGVLHQQFIKVRAGLYTKDDDVPEKVKIILDPKTLSEKQLEALFRSGLLAEVFPNLKRLKGLVQHDHYHRYTVDAHTVQALRFFIKVKQDPDKYLESNSQWVKHFDDRDWQILFWSCFYHDQAKGLKGSHSELGADVARLEMQALGFDDDLIESVAWLIAKHLLLAQAAFRRNPEDKSTWSLLKNNGVNSQNIKWLAALTCVDIMATNIEAWTSWKSQLLYRLVSHYIDPDVSSFLNLNKDLLEFGDEAQVFKFLSGLDSSILEEVPTKCLRADFKVLLNSSTDLPALAVLNDNNDIWVRFHSREDQSGLFLAWTHLLFSTGCMVREAYVHTFSEWGAYNWIKVRAHKTVDVIEKQFEVAKLVDYSDLEIKFNSIKSLGSVGKDRWILRFKGFDQRGVLVKSVAELTRLNLNIHWARVHTWGDVLENIFHVSSKDSDLQEADYLNQLKDIFS